MDIIIGREDGVSRLHVVAGGREFNLGQAGSVPRSVSRQHCRLTVNGGDITIQNMKPQNVTYVDGNQIFSKSITAASQVQLGADRYTVPLQQILQLAGVSAQGSPSVGSFSLQPLESVWDEYDRRRLEIQENAAKLANRQRIQGILSMLAMLIGFFPGIDPTVRVLIILAALAVAIYFFVKGSRDKTVTSQLHDLDEEFAAKYKCPNPACGKPFGAIPYRSLKYNKQCFSCGCKYTN